MNKIDRKKLVFYLGPFSFPDGGAAAKRIKYIIKSIQECDIDTLIASGQNGDENYKVEENIRYISLNERDSEHLPRVLKHLSYITMGKKTIQWLDSLEKKPDLIILYSGYSPYLIRLLIYCKKHNIKLVFDAVEWYGAGTHLGTLSPYYLNIEIAMRYLIPKTDGVICISSYLQDYYQSKGMNTIFVPPTTVVKKGDLRERNPLKPVTLVYAGSPDGSKDELETIVSVVNQLLANKLSIELNIIGITKDQFCASYNWPKHMCIDERIIFYGRVSHYKAIKFVGEADFSILLRENKKSSNAGFSTKFVESLSLGTPVIANLTGDIGRYLVNHYNGYVVPSESFEEISKVIRNAALLDNEEIMTLSQNSLITAKNNFHYKKYTPLIDSFINSTL